MAEKLEPEEKQAIALERLRQDIKSARPRREYIREALRNGSRPEYVAMRYGIPLDDILKAKRVWDAEDERAKQRADVARGNAEALREFQQSPAQAPVGHPTIAGDGV